MTYIATLRDVICILTNFLAQSTKNGILCATFSRFKVAITFQFQSTTEDFGSRSAGITS